jgi:hypothetical protein
VITICFDINKHDSIRFEYDGVNLTIPPNLENYIDDLDQLFQAIIFLLKRNKGFELARLHNKEN